MDEEMAPRFFQALMTMSEFFGDELSELRQRTYWTLLHPQVTIEEWEDACLQAMTHETFHKVPLVARLLAYVQAFRQSRVMEEQIAQALLTAGSTEATAQHRAEREAVEAELDALLARNAHPEHKHWPRVLGFTRLPLTGGNPDATASADDRALSEGYGDR